MRELIPWRKENRMLEKLASEMDRLFEDFLGSGWRRLGPLEESYRYPAVDFVDQNDRLTITAEIPGMDEKDVELSIVGDTLVLKGEKKVEKEEERGNVYRRERHFGRFERHMSLPAGLDLAKARATCKHGVLQIDLPKTTEAKARSQKIEIRSIEGKAAEKTKVEEPVAVGAGGKK